MLNSFAPLAWIVTLIITVCFVFSLVSSRGGAGFNWLLALAVLLWALYSCWETFFINPLEDSIRVDLVVIFPVLLIISIAGLIRWLKG